jgi:hypothetical protein
MHGQFFMTKPETPLVFPDFTPTDEVQMELLQYEDPDGLHPVESQWRSLCRRLLKHVTARDMMLKELTEKSYSRTALGQNAEEYFKERNYKPIKLPEPFRK